jgi:phosphohistidine phosphatase SixA
VVKTEYRAVRPRGEVLQDLSGDQDIAGIDQQKEFAVRRFVSRMRKCLFVPICLGLLAIAATAHAQQSGTQAPEQLVEKLREGGYVLYVRHATTDHAQADTDLSDFSRCEFQRNLSAQGRRESETMAAAFAALEIKVDQVYTSPYCRCVDTASIVFGRFEIVDDMRATFFTNQEETAYLVDFLRSQLSSVPKAGFNTVLVGHTANLRDLTTVWPKPEGVAHVFKPLGGGEFEHLGRIMPTDWEAFVPPQ